MNDLEFVVCNLKLNDNQVKNHALHIVLLTKDREFRRFKDKQLPDMRANF